MSKLKDLARASGVVGAGGAGFPTHVKIDAQVNIVIINGAECEPLITADQALMQAKGQELAAAVERVRMECAADEAIIAVKGKHRKSVEAMRSAISGYPAVRLCLLDDKYPAGDEYVLVYEVTGRQIAHSGIPLDCGVVVLNVETLWNLHEAANGRPVTLKWISVSGEVQAPGTYVVPIGVSAAEVVNLAGGTLKDCALVDGGPMMGKLIPPDNPVTKTTKALLVLPEDSPVILNRTASLEALLRQARAVCCQCHLCTDLCPRNLLGYDIHPDQTMLAASYSWSVGGTSATQAYLCSECGACETFACPMGLSPRRINQRLKAMLIQEQVANPYKGKAAVASEWRAYRRIPTDRLASRLGIGRYYTPETLLESAWQPQRLVFPLKQHVGRASIPLVSQGQTVNAGTLLADIPEQALGSRIFTALGGVVEAVEHDRIVLRTGG